MGGCLPWCSGTPAGRCKLSLPAAAAAAGAAGCVRVATGRAVGCAHKHKDPKAGEVCGGSIICHGRGLVLFQSGAALYAWGLPLVLRPARWQRRGSSSLHLKTAQSLCVCQPHPIPPSSSLGAPLALRCSLSLDHVAGCERKLVSSAAACGLSPAPTGGGADMHWCQGSSPPPQGKTVNQFCCSPAKAAKRRLSSSSLDLGCAGS